MSRLYLLITALIFAASSAVAGPRRPIELKDLYFGEALYCAFQSRWFDAIARLDTELAQHYGLDEPQRDSLYVHIDHAEFAVGDFELAYRMHHRAGRAIKAVIEGTDAFVRENKEIVSSPEVLRDVLYCFARELWLSSAATHLPQPPEAPPSGSKAPADTDYEEYFFNYVYNHGVYPR